MPIEYSRQKFPSAPVLNVRLSQPGEMIRTVELTALIDTGGDFTTVSLDWLLQIGAPEVRWAYLRGVWGEQRAVTLYLVDLHLDTGVLPGVEAVSYTHLRAHET